MIPLVFAVSHGGEKGAYIVPADPARHDNTGYRHNCTYITKSVAMFISINTRRQCTYTPQ
jgi:hypothetical protein